MKIVSRKILSKYKDYDNHLYVFEKNDSKCGLHSFVAIHNNNLGPATGGTRIYPYETERDAITDVLRLSKAMSYKCAISGVKFGGGKGVIVADPYKYKSLDFLKSYAEFINDINNKYVCYTTGEDVGVTENDIEVMSSISKYIVGTKDKAGDPSPFAALSTYLALKEVVELCFAPGIMGELKVAIKGVGKVGRSLIKLLLKDNTSIYISDINKGILKVMKNKYPQLKIIDNSEILKKKVDIYSPCALGKEFDSKSYKLLNCKIVCGAANNQLSTPEIGDGIFSRGIVYIPDYIANCGGLINVVDQLENGGYKRRRVLSRIRNIRKMVRLVINISKNEKIPPNRVADKIAENIFLN